MVNMTIILLMAVSVATSEAIRQVLARLQAARGATDVFGSVDTAETLGHAYRRAAKSCHPDLFPDDAQMARDAFVLLTRWYEIAREQLRHGTYGQAPPQPAIRLQHKHRVYEVEPQAIFQGDFANVYRGVHDGAPVAVKVARQSRDGDLLCGERATLRRIEHQVEKRFHPFFPRLLDSFVYQEPSGEQRATNVLSWVNGAYTLKEIRRAYPAGVDPKDVAWIWRRLLVALGAAHRAGIVHGAALPSHVCVLPEEHGLVLIGWTSAVEAGRPVPAISSAYEQWYPKEVMAKEAATAATDVALGARCMLFLLGEDAPAAFSRFFRGCLLPSPRQRPHDAWALLREFDEVLDRLWGPRRFHPFSVPAPCSR